MQPIAREIGLSETVFFGESPVSRLKALPLRIFTPEREVTFAGHPLVGSAWLIEELPPGKPAERLAPPSGEVEAWRVGEKAWIRTPPPPVRNGPDDIFSIVEMLGSEPIDLTPRIPPAFSGHGQEWLILPFAEPDRVLRLEPDMEALAAHPIASGGIYCFAMRGSDVTARFFAPAFGVPEDPGTGSAAISLAAYLIRYHRRAPRDFTISQGSAIDMPCSIDVSISDRGVALGGRVVLDGTHQLPEPAM